MQRNQYLDAIGLNIENYGGNFIRKRKIKRFLERRRYGFDHREIINMDISFAEWLYSHLMMFQERTTSDLTFHSVEFEGQTYTIEQAINKILDISRSMLLLYVGLDMEGEAVPDKDREQIDRDMKEAVKLWAEIMRYMWI